MAATAAASAGGAMAATQTSAGSYSFRYPIASDGESVGGGAVGGCPGALAGGVSPQAVDHTRGHGHFFTRKTFHRPTYCHHCTDMLWGLIGQGYVCEGKSLVFLGCAPMPCSLGREGLVKRLCLV